MPTLTSTQRSFLRAKAHSLNPVVMIADSGLSENVMKELERSIASHELIKVKVAATDRSLRDSMLEQICAELNAAPVQHIGKILVIYRPAAKPTLTLPK